MSQIAVTNLRKVFTTVLRRSERGFFANLLRPEKKEIVAVDDVSFSIERGERVAFIGPNGAGKSTTIKMLAGILQPTSGSITVCGLSPGKDRRALAAKVGTLFGQRSQLFPNLPLMDGFELFGALYGLTTATVKRRRKELMDRFDLHDFAHQPVRKLSLGQRMRAEVAVSLLHKPDVLFLDEPTIGLDIVAKRALRETLLAYNADEGVTILLTSHDPSDVEVLCPRTMVINHGRLIIDTPTDDLRTEYFTTKHVAFALPDGATFAPLPGFKLTSRDGNTVTGIVDTAKHDLHAVLKELLARYAVTDLDVADPSMEEVIEAVYARAK